MTVFYRHWTDDRKLFTKNILVFVTVCVSLQCFDVVGWMTDRKGVRPI